MKIRKINRKIKKSIKDFKRDLYNIFFDIDNSNVDVKVEKIKKNFNCEWLCNWKLSGLYSIN